MYIVWLLNYKTIYYVASIVELHAGRCTNELTSDFLVTLDPFENWYNVSSFKVHSKYDLIREIFSSLYCSLWWKCIGNFSEMEY